MRHTFPAALGVARDEAAASSGTTVNGRARRIVSLSDPRRYRPTVSWTTRTS